MDFMEHNFKYNKSRMMGDYQVRFCERLGVKFPLPTRQKTTTMTDFTEKFTAYSNTDLLKIIDSPDDFQPLAVETAKSIFASRQLSDKDKQY
jgi:hypothetical protein